MISVPLFLEFQFSNAASLNSWVFRISLGFLEILMMVPARDSLHLSIFDKSDEYRYIVMNSFFKEVLEYHHHYNEKLLEEVKNHLHKLPQRTFPLYCHILNAHQIWNARISNGEPFGVLEVHPMESCKEINDSNCKDTAMILEMTDLKKPVQYRNTRGQNFVNTVQDILFHIFNHSTHHKAQIISDFRQASVVPLVTDYIFYKRDHGNQ
jgi:uncharacterized damage-inducible protein DinB